MLTVLENLPEGFLAVSAQQLDQVLPGPALIHLPGYREPPLFVSVLLHGNEDTGLKAVQALLRRYQNRELPRALSLFVGNVTAAKEGLRRLDGQPDYNRVWPGGEHEHSAEAAMTREVLEEMRLRRVFASVDVHNNTGLNPHYACINRLDHRFMHLATLFGRTVVYFIRPRGVQSLAFAELCPAVTLECGQPGSSHSVEHALEYLDACLHLSEIPEHPVAHHDIDLFHTVATVKVPEDVSFSFNGEAVDIRFLKDLDHMNFRELPVATLLGHVSSARARLEAWDENGQEVSERYFAVDNGELRLVRRVMPSMLTLDTRIVRQDCLCYLMERMEV